MANNERKLNGTVIVTYRCNARCSMCNRYKAPSKPEEEISIETIKKLPKMYFTNITGGEPFIRTDLKDIVRELYKNPTVSLFPRTVSSQTVLLICAKNSRRLEFVFLLRAWKRPTTRFAVCRMATSVVTVR